MDLEKLRKSMENCPCGKDHPFDLKGLEVDSGNLARVATLLDKYDFPKNIMVVTDKNALKASDGILKVLEDGGYKFKLKIYDDMKEARMVEVDELRGLMQDVDGVLSVGSGSCNDICRYSTYLEKKEFAIFGTAHSMDGFASNSAPILKEGFKITYFCHQPSVIIADTKILAKAPVELKRAGFGDMMAKYIAMADWRIATLIYGEHYCARVADLVRDAMKQISALAPYVSCDDESAVKAIMEALALTGIAMQCTGTSRPASGAEHVVSHFWECKKIEKGLFADYHGKKVGVATLMIAEIYHKVADMKNVKARKENVDWDAVKQAYGPNLIGDVMKLNNPTITEEIDPATINEKWDEVVKAIKEEIPPMDKLRELYAQAGAYTTIEDVKVDEKLCEDGLRYHAFMRKRVNLTRLMPMLGLDIVDVYKM